MEKNSPFSVTPLGMNFSAKDSSKGQLRSHRDTVHFLKIMVAAMLGPRYEVFGDVLATLL